MVKGIEENPLEKRLRRKMEGLYENEALTSDLDDDSADVLLKWASDRVESIVRSTADLDDEQAEEAMYPRMRALRKMFRYVNRLAKGTEDPEKMLEKIVIQAKEIYGDAFTEPDMAKLESLLELPAGDPKTIMQSLRNVLEGEQGGE